MIKQKIQPWAVLLLSTLLVLPVTGFSGTSTVHAATDTQNHWAKQVLNDWQNKGYISGFEDGSLKPDQSVTRSQLAALINKAYGFTHTASIQYTDVQPSDWYYNDVAIAKAEGYMEGYKDSTFHPNKQVSRQELAVILTSLKKLKSSNSASTLTDTANSPSWSKGSIGAVIDSGLMKGDEKGFRPKDTTTRAEAVTVLDRSLQAATSAATVYNTAGVYGPASGQQSLSGNVQLNAAGSTLRNTIVEGDLILGEGIGEGDILLDHVTVKGTTTINGGGSHSIHIKDSTLPNMIVNKPNGTVRIVSSGLTNIQQTTLQKAAILEEEQPTASGFHNVLMTAQLPSSTSVSLKGNYDTIDMSSSDTMLSISSGGSINQFAVAADAMNNRITLNPSSSINVFTTNAPTTVNGEGTINHAIIQSSDVTITPKVIKTTIGSEITARVEGNIVGSPKAETNLKKDNKKGESPTVIFQPTTPSTIQPKTYNLSVWNGAAVLPDSVNYAELNMNDMIITVMVDGQAAPNFLQSLHFDIEKHMIKFKPLITTFENYGKTVQIIVEPSGSSSLLKDRFTGKFQITGVYGHVMDQNEKVVSNMQISFRHGADVTRGLITETVETDENGLYTVDLPSGVYTAELQKYGYAKTYITMTVLADEYKRTDMTVVPTVQLDQVRIVLTWGRHPVDEDVHLLGPTLDGNGFHISSFENEMRNYDKTGQLYASIDQDVWRGYGPETTTIHKPLDGKYTFLVKNLSGNTNGTLRTSASTVKVYIGDSTTPIKSYTVPTGDGNEQLWHVFDLNVTNGTFEFIDQNSLSNKELQSPDTENSNDGTVSKSLKTQAAYVPSSLILGYKTEINQKILQLLEVPNNSEVEQSIDTIATIPSSAAMNVTADTYLQPSEHNDDIRFMNYNDSSTELAFSVKVNFRMNDQQISRIMRIYMPTLDEWLDTATRNAEYIIFSNSESTTIALQEAVTHRQALSTNATTSDKVAVLNELRVTLATWMNAYSVKR